MSLDSLVVKRDNESCNIDQADIFKDISFSVSKDISCGILVTPTCDLSRLKGAVLFCAVIDFEVVIQELFQKNMNNVSLQDFVDNGNVLTKGQYKNLKEEVLENFLNNKYARYHWIGRIPQQEGFWCVDFSYTSCYSPDKIDLKNRIASLEAPLRESVSAGYANYMNRVGLPWERVDRVKMAEEILEYIAPEILPPDYK